MIHNVDVREPADAGRDPRRARAAGGEPGALGRDGPRRFAARGVTHVVECGPGKVLAGLIKRIDADARVARAVHDPAMRSPQRRGDWLA